MEEKYKYIVDLIFEYENDGKSKTEKESWLITAISVSDAEVKANKEIDKIAKGIAASAVMSCRIKNVKESPITKVIE